MSGWRKVAGLPGAAVRLVDTPAGQEVWLRHAGSGLPDRWPVIHFTRDEFSALLAAIRAGEFDDL